jgi:hypothetical protein
LKHHFLTPLQDAAPQVQSKQHLKLFLIISESVDCLVCSDEDLRRNILTDFASINWLTVSIHIYIKVNPNELFDLFTRLQIHNFYRQMLWFFFHPHLRIKSKASAYMSRHLHIESKTSAYTIGTCFRFYMQMRVENNNKAFAYRVPIGDYNYLQCRKDLLFSDLIW